jgi:alpha-tubulin suppressor-like RCC1 family protein
MTDMRQVVAGGNHTCSLFETGRVYCWGSNSKGQLGNGTTTNRLTGTLVSSLTEAAYLSAAGNTTCAARSVNGTAKCWGWNNAAQVGTGSSSPSSVLTPATVVGLAGATELEIGSSGPDNYQGTSCVVRGGGDVKCWGFGLYGQMGNGTTEWINEAPVAATLDVPARSTVSLSAEDQILVIRPDGTNRAWRWTAATSPAPTGTMYTTPRMVSTTFTHSCALLTDGTVQCWGYNEFGSVGDGTFTDRANPTDVVGLLDFEAVHLDVGNYTSCVALTDGGARCWGAGDAFKLGDGTFWEHSPVPVVVQGLQDAVIQVAVAHESVCALLVDGRVTCWGEGGLDSSTGSAGDPQKQFPGLTDPLAAPAVALAGGAGYFWPDGYCALLATGRVQCWGHYPGNGSDYSDVPALVALGSARAVAVDRTGENGCVIIDDGTLRCWGENDQGQLGIGFSGSPIYLPITVSGIDDVIAVAIGGDGAPEEGEDGSHMMCALTAGGDVYCWGEGFGDTPQHQMTL